MKLDGFLIKDFAEVDCMARLMGMYEGLVEG